MNTNSSPAQSKPLTANALVKPTPAQGFSILYNVTTNILLELPGTVVKTYLAITTLANGKREQPEIKPWLMGLLNLNEEQIDRALEMLIEENLIYILKRKDKADEWYLMPPPMDIPANPVIYPATPLHTSVPGSGQQAASSAPTSPPPPAPRAASNGSAPSQGHPSAYWDANPKALKFLDAMLSKWPKPTSRQDAMRAWVEKFGETEMTHELQESIWLGFNWWLRFWKNEGTAEQYINQASSWIAKEKWRDARVVAANAN